MPVLLLLVIPTVLTLGLSPFLGRHLPVQRLAAILGFVVAVVLTSLFVISEWRASYGAWKVAEAALAVLFNSLLVALVHWSVWSLGLRLWRRLRSSPSSTTPARDD